jgi:hypothetical protein
VEDRETIRRAYFIEKKSLRQIAKELRVARKTVRKALASAEPEAYTLGEPRPAPILGPYKDRIDGLLAANEKLPVNTTTPGICSSRNSSRPVTAAANPTVRRYIAHPTGFPARRSTCFWIAPGASILIGWSA